MKHAGQKSLDELDGLLKAIRTRPGIKEKSRGVFYRSGRAWLHFHEDPAGLFADLQNGEGWHRFPVSLPAERKTLIAAIDQALGS